MEQNNKNKEQALNELFKIIDNTLKKRSSEMTEDFYVEYFTGDRYNDQRDDVKKLSTKIDIIKRHGIMISDTDALSDAATYGDYAVVKMLLSKEKFTQKSLDEALQCACVRSIARQDEIYLCADIAELLALHGANATTVLETLAENGMELEELVCSRIKNPLPRYEIKTRLAKYEEAMEEFYLTNKRLPNDAELLQLRTTKNNNGMLPPGIGPKDSTNII